MVNMNDLKELKVLEETFIKFTYLSEANKHQSCKFHVLWKASSKSFGIKNYSSDSKMIITDLLCVSVEK